ncbi:hypothetical protein LCGC14_2736640, partial [marine sediment metagenome]
FTKARTARESLTEGTRRFDVTQKRLEREATQKQAAATEKARAATAEANRNSVLTVNGKSVGKARLTTGAASTLKQQEVVDSHQKVLTGIRRVQQVMEDCGPDAKTFGDANCRKRMDLQAENAGVAIAKIRDPVGAISDSSTEAGKRFLALRNSITARIKGFFGQGKPKARELLAEIFRNARKDAHTHLSNTIVGFRKSTKGKNKDKFVRPNIDIQGRRLKGEVVGSPFTVEPIKKKPRDPDVNTEKFSKARLKAIGNPFEEGVAVQSKESLEDLGKLEVRFAVSSLGGLSPLQIKSKQAQLNRTATNLFKKVEKARKVLKTAFEEEETFSVDQSPEIQEAKKVLDLWETSLQTVLLIRGVYPKGK